MGYEVVERNMNIDELIDSCRLRRCKEAFACGTAVIITPISKFIEHDGTEIPLQLTQGEISPLIRQRLLDIQEGRHEGPKGWSVPVQEKF